MSQNHQDPDIEVLKLQIARLVSDRESDKMVYRDVHKTLHKRIDECDMRIRELEVHWAKASGVLVGLSILIQVILHFLKS